MKGFILNPHTTIFLIVVGLVSSVLFYNPVASLAWLVALLTALRLPER